MRTACALAALGWASGATVVAVPSAPSSIATCDDRVARQPRSLDAWRCYLRWGRRGTAEGDAARRRLEAALAFDRENHAARFALASVEADQGRERADELYLAAIDGFARTGDAAGGVHARLGLAFFLSGRGRLDESEKEIERASEATAAAGPEVGGWVSVSRAWARYHRADYGGAEVALRTAEPAIFPGGIVPLQSAWLSAMGGALWGMGRFPEALAVYRHQAELLEASGDRYEEAQARANVALLTSQTYGADFTAGQRADLARLANEALAAAVAGGNRATEGAATNYLVQLLPPGPERRRRSERAVALLSEFQSSSYLDAVRILAADLIYTSPRQTERAFLLLDQAQSVAVAHGDLQGAARAAVAQMTLLWYLSREAGADPALGIRARAASVEALDAIEAIRDRQPDDEVRARTFATWVYQYHRVAGHLLEASGGKPAPDDLEGAFTAMERRRARVLLEEFDRSGASGALAAARPGDEARREVLARIGGILGRLRGGLAAAERAAAVADLGRLAAEETALRAGLAETDPPFAVWRGAIAALREVEAELGEGEAMLSFQTANTADSAQRFGGGSWLLAHTSEGTRAYRLPDERDLEVAVDLLVGLTDAGEPAAAAAAERLFTDLLAPAFADLPQGIDRLILIPDGPLHRLPFGALRPAPEAGPLGLRYRMSRAPSATSWLRLRRAQPRPAEAPLLALADPSDPGGTSAREASASGGGAEQAAERAGRTSPPAGVAPGREVGVRAGRVPLPFARWESRAAARHLGRGARVLTGAAATEAALRSAEPGRFAVVHLAAHALADPSEPSRSAVFLAAEKGEDGRLTMAEIVGLDLDGGTVVLAGCRGASGPRLEGEGVLSLARAFFVAGAYAVVGSLGDLRDEEAARLLDRFYFHLGRGAALDEALLRARRDRAADGATATAWAGIEILGDGAGTPLPGGRRERLAPWHLAFATALVSMAAAARALRLRRRRGLA